MNGATSGAPPAENFGIAVRQLREARGWSQEALAGRADLNRSYVGEIERGSAIPSLQTLDKLALALGLPVSSLMQRYEEVCQVRSSHRINLAAIAC